MNGRHFKNTLEHMNEHIMSKWSMVHVFSSTLLVASIYSYMQTHTTRTGVLTLLLRSQLMGEHVASLAESAHLVCVLFFRSGASAFILWDLITIFLSPPIREARPLGPNTNSPQHPVHFINKLIASNLPSSCAYALTTLGIWCNHSFFWNQIV